MNAAHKRKLLILCFVGALLAFFGRAIPQVALTDRAIVIGMGIDYEEGEYTVVVQVLSPVSMGKSGSSNDSYGIYSGSGKSLSRAINTIMLETGLKVSLSQCNILIFGNKMVENDIIPSINYLVQSYQIPEQAVLVVTDKTALELLQARPLMSKISALQLQKTLSSMSENEGVINTDIKDFLSGYLSFSGTSAVDMVTYTMVSPENMEGESSSGNSDFVVFDYGKSMLFSNSKPPMALDKNDTFSINHTLEKLKTGGLSVEIEGERFFLQLTKNKKKSKAEIDGERLKFSFEIESSYFVAEVEDIGKYYSVSDITDELLDKIAEEARKITVNSIMETFEKCRATGYDVFKIYNKAYSSEGIKWKEIAPDNYLDIIDFNIEAKIKVVRK